MTPIEDGAAVSIVMRTLDGAIDTHRRVRALDLGSVTTAAAIIGGALGSGASSWRSATAAAPATRSTWWRSSSAGFRRSGRDLPRSR